MINTHRTSTASPETPIRYAPSSTGGGTPFDTANGAGLHDAPPAFVAESLWRDGRSPSPQGATGSGAASMAETVGELTEHEHRALSEGLALAASNHPDAQAGLKLLGTSFAALEGMPVEDWPAVSTTLRRALEASGTTQASPPPPALRTLTVHVNIDSLEGLFLELMKMQIAIGRSASLQYLKVLDNMVDAAKRKGEAMISEAKTNFALAVTGAAISGVLGVAGAGAKIWAGKKTLATRNEYASAVGNKQIPADAPQSAATTVRSQTKLDRSLAENAMKKGCAIADQVSAVGDIAATVGRSLGDISRAAGDLAANEFKIAQLNANTDQTIYESLRNDEKERIGKAIQMANSFLADYRAYIDKRASALDAAASTRMA